MDIFYKYYSSEFNVLKHLESPSIKLANVASFNDPFENQLADGLITMLAKKTMQSLHAEDEMYEKEFQEIFKLLNIYFGVVTLTETHRNLLMWAHYASSHSGVCIGYKADFFDKLDKTLIKSELPDVDIKYLPHRVIYDSKRFDEERFEYIDTSYHGLFTHVLNAMSKKSDEWIYEKEHRCIIPFVWTDKISVKPNSPKIIKDNIAILVEEGMLRKDKEEHDYIFIDHETIERTKHLLSRNPNIIMLKNIEIESIDSIYIGSRYDPKDADKLTEKIKSNPSKYGHIKLYKYKVNENDFSLDIVPIS